MDDISKAFPSTLESLKLVVIEIKESELKDICLKCTQLKKLSFQNCENISDLSFLQYLPNSLKSLSLVFQLVMKLPALQSLGRLTNLTSFSAESTYFSDKELTYLPPSLKVLNISGINATRHYQ
jgi:hypothetical protein